jgi:hypothetical protein
LLPLLVPKLSKDITIIITHTSKPPMMLRPSPPVLMLSSLVKLVPNPQLRLLLKLRKKPSSQPLLM